MNSVAGQLIQKAVEFQPLLKQQINQIESFGCENHSEKSDKQVAHTLRIFQFFLGFWLIISFVSVQNCVNWLIDA